MSQKWLMAGHRNRITIIDDESDMANLFSEGLEMAGFKTTAFDDPEDAIEYISVNHSKIALTTVDWWMPLMDGFRIMKLISDIDSNIRLLLISGYDLTEEQPKASNNVSYLKKAYQDSQTNRNRRERINSTNEY